MNISFINKITLITGFSLTIAASQAWSNENQALELQKIMRDMDKNMQLITHAISYEDWPLIAKTAPLIANHPKPPAGEKLRILTYLGSQMSSFKQHDAKTHKAATQLTLSAENNEAEEVISTFATLQTSCLACHQQFRQAFQEHFYTLPK